MSTVNSVPINKSIEEVKELNAMKKNFQNRFAFSFENCFQHFSFRIEDNSNSVEHIHSNAKLCCCSNESIRKRISKFPHMIL